MKTVIELAKEAGYQEGRPMSRLEKFAALVRAEALAEQPDKPEECAYGCPENTVCDYCQRAEPVKHEVNQEPVAWWDTGHCVTMDKFEAGADWTPLYPNTFDIEALTEAQHKAFQSYVDQVKADRELAVLQARLEALEEAAKVCEERLQIPMLDAAHTMEIQLCAAAIRGLK